ncbi:MAG: hypothetical protein HWN79_18075 [Candidatus Lokiarchaeota archaeon]|nr:hypothetical protein [Candidatus Lokiarchaeota archaeon]
MPKKKFYYLISVLFIIFLTIAGINARAHPPQSLSLVYDSNTNMLEVSITHAVSDNTSHYIFSVVVSVNGSIDQSPAYDSQPDLVFFIYEYSVITKNGSTIGVTASCIEGGSLTRTLGGSNAPPEGGIPGYMGLYLVLFVTVITLVALNRKKLKKL